MPAGLPYFAWIDASETVFGSEHMRWDESIFSFTCEQNEGNPANLTVVVKRPRNVSGDPIGLLGPGRKIWAWFALDCGPSLFRFRGRLVGVPTSIFEELVTLEFVARPFDVVAQKEALAATLRVLPYYDEVMLDPERRTDPEVVLEGYSKIWHYNRESHVLTVSDEINGEDGLVEFDGASEDGKVLYDGLGLSLTSGPLARVDLTAEFAWTQQAHGTVGLTEYLTDNWPQDFADPGIICSFTLSADGWPKAGAGIGDGWTVAESTARELYDNKVTTTSSSGTVTTKWWDGDTTTVTKTESKSTVAIVPGGSLLFGRVVTTNTSSITYAKDSEGTYVASSQSNYAASDAYLPPYHFQPTMLAGYSAARPFTEVVSLSLVADVQHILTDPEDGEALRLDDIKSVNLSESIGEGEAAYIPMGDPARRSYIATARGNQSIEHLIALARAHLLKRSRVVEISFAPKLSRMAEVTLRKNAFLIEPRVGEATGKIIGYSISLDGADGRIGCEVTVGCAIGRGGSQIAAGGDPTYCEEAYAGADYQQFTGRIVLFDTSVGYAPPNANPNDDGITFTSALTVEDVLETPLLVENPASVQFDYLASHVYSGGWHQPPGFTFDYEDTAATLLQARSTDAANALKEVPTKATFKLKSMTKEFSTPYEIQTTDLKVPTGYDLEAV